MDFSNRGSQPQPISRPNQSLNDVGGRNNHNTQDKLPKKSPHDDVWARVAVVVAVAAVVVLLVGVITLALTKTEDKKDNNQATAEESAYIIEKDMQAVFLNTGQVYFGDISSMNNDYLVLNNIYYLQADNSNNAASTNNVSLVKLGCELHKPNDQMIINRDQVTFWENLGEKGKVAQAVKQYRERYPDGNKECVDQSTSSSTNSGTTVQGAQGDPSRTNTGSTTNP